MGIGIGEINNIIRKNCIYSNLFRDPFDAGIAVLAASSP
jgi:hypothetical protein